MLTLGAMNASGWAAWAGLGLGVINAVIGVWQARQRRRVGVFRELRAAAAAVRNAAREVQAVWRDDNAVRTGHIEFPGFPRPDQGLLDYGRPRLLPSGEVGITAEYRDPEDVARARTWERRATDYTVATMQRKAAADSLLTDALARLTDLRSRTRQLPDVPGLIDTIRQATQRLVDQVKEDPSILATEEDAFPAVDGAVTHLLDRLAEIESRLRLL